MNVRYFCLAAAVSAAALTGCSQSSFEPKVTGKVDPVAQSTLQFVVGTANVAGTVGLNTVETLRQSSGANIGASVLSNAPTIAGPSGFVVPKTTDAYNDGGTNTITGILQTSLTATPPPTTFDPPYSTNPENPTALNAIASSYGFTPATVGNSSFTPNLFPYSLPFYAAANPALSASAEVAQPCFSVTPGKGIPVENQLCYIGGPPAFVPHGHTSTQDGTFPSGYSGFVLGFVDFQAAPVSGTYTLNVQVPTGFQGSTETYGKKTTTASLTSLAALPAWATPPTFTSDGHGGGTITTNFANAGGTTEEYLELVNIGIPTSSGNSGFACQVTGSGPYYYTFKVTPDTAEVTVPDNLGATHPGNAQPHTLCTASEDGGSTGDQAVVYGFAVDYPLFNSAFPQSQGAPAPGLAGANGQADVTTSLASAGNE